MNENTIAVIQECSHRSNQGTISFPEVVGKLIAIGVESYHVDFYRNEKTFYFSNGESHLEPDSLALSANDIAPSFSAEGVQQTIKASQRGEINYQEFLRRVMAAGCIGYVAYLAGKRVAYVGRSGENHVEYFPNKSPALIEFDTERLRVRQWRESDFAPFAVLNADPKAMEYFPKLLSRTESDEMAQRVQTLIAERGWGLWAVEIKATHEFIGFVGLHIPTVELPFSPCVEIGWRLAAAHWGQGYAPEAAKAALRIGFETLDLDEIVSFTALKNRRSRRVMEKLGMREDAATFEHPNVPVGNPLREHCLYRLSREQWQTYLSKI